ncbi:MAG: hypothetical protein OXF01_17555 [Gemmatimonadetes bacterium]|nr:hypothetical protein [Gemmatimonadota bacterium]
MANNARGSSYHWALTTRRFFGCAAGHLSRLASAVSRAFRLLACALAGSLAVASCIGSAGEDGFRAEKFDSLVSRLADATSGSANVADFALADSICAGAGPDSVTGAAVDSSSGSDPVAQGVPRPRDRVREELVAMGFSACVRSMSRTVQRDEWLRQDRLTDLVAWKGDAAVEDAIYVPVRYSLPVRGEAERSDSSWVRPVAAVLEAVRAFLADPARADNGEPSDGAARKPMVLSFTNAEQLDGMGDIPATGDSRPVGTAWVASAPGPQSPRVTTPDVGWMVGQLRSTEGRVSFPGPETQLPVRVAELNTDSAGRGLCESGAWCDLIVPANPPVHVHAMFFSDDVRVGTDEARRMGERTLEVLRAANTLAYGAALPVQPVSWAELYPLLWWLLPCGLLVGTVVWAFIAPLGSISAAIGIARRARWVAWWNRPLAVVWRFALGIVLFFLRRLGSEREISKGTGEAIARPKRLYEEAVEALRSLADAPVGAASRAWADELLKEGRTERSPIGQWAKNAAAWESDFVGRVADCEKLVREAEKAQSEGETARDRMDGIRNSLRKVQEQSEDVEVRASAAEAMGTVAEALRAAAKAVRRDGRELRRDGRELRWNARQLRWNARELRFGAASSLQGIAVLRYGTARVGLKCLIMWLREKRDEKRDHLATSFNRLGRVLAEFFTLSWNGRVVACGFAALAAAVHGFVARVDDPIMNVALSGVSEDVWTLVYVGLGAMVFLASALQWGEFSIGESAEQSLLYWNEKTRRIGTESIRPVSLLDRLKRRSRRAVGCYVLLLLVPIATSCNVPVLGPELVALRNPTTPPGNPHLWGSLTLDHAILSVLVVAFLFPAVWVRRHLKRMAKDGS